MAAIWKFFTQKAALSYLLVLAIVLFGLFAALTLQRESAPEIQVPVAIVTSVLPGASPSDVETLIVDELERAVANIDGIDELTSSSREGVGTVVVQFDAAADIDESIDKVKDEVDKVRGDLPEDATDPTVSDVNFADQPIMFIALLSDLPATEFKVLADSVSDELESVGGVSRVDATGLRDREVNVIVHKEDLALHSLTLGDVTRAIALNNAALPVGTLEVRGVEYPLELRSDIEDTSEVAGIPVTTSAGTVLRLSEIAFVADGVEDFNTISRVSVEGAPSQQAATHIVYKQRGADITKATAAIHEKIDELNETIFDSATQAFVAYDAGAEINRDLRTLSFTGLQTVLLVLLVLLLALGWREALIASLSIPLSFLTAFIFLQVSGNTLNFISLFSLILSIGILVDTAIVITEAIHSNMKRQLKASLANGETAATASADKTKAALDAIEEFHYPLTTGNLTTIAVFVPLFTISGVTGEFIDSIPYTVISVLLASLVVSLAFIPLIASTFLKRRSVTALEQKQEHYADNVRNWYRRRIPYLLDSRKRKWWFVGGLIGLFIFSFMLPAFGLVKVTFFPQTDVDFMYIELKEPQGTPLAHSDLAIRAVEEELYDIPEIESFTTTVGAGSAFNENAGSGPRYASVTLYLRPAKERNRTSTKLVTVLEERLRKYPDLDLDVLQPTSGPPTGSPVVITFYGDELAELKKLAVSAADLLRTVPGSRNVRSSGESDASQFTLRIDRERAAELGLTPLSVAETLRTAVYGTEATTIKKGGKEIDVIVKLNLNTNFLTPHDTDRATVDMLRELPIATQKGVVLLDSVVDVHLGASSDVISHEDEKRIATASSQLEEGFVAGDVTTVFRERAATELAIPSGVTMKVGGETEETDQSFADSFRSLFMGIVLIFGVLVVQFNSYKQAFIIVSVFFLSEIGVMLGLLLTGQALSFPTILGIIALAGIVVNNGIILIDQFNHIRKREPDLPLRDVVIEGAASRLRPIALTAITTVVGITPLVFASDLWRPIAIAIIFGLSFAVILTLILVPILYLKWCKKV